ncbi:MAG: type IV pilus assembly protein PilM [Peptococcaceae bacterium]|nr:type IV pilus assembly protein PilM [Peptococcaceae bacterium]
MAEQTVAIDIGSYAIKGVVVRAGKELQKIVSQPTPPGAIEGGNIRDPEQISAVIKSVWTELAVKNTQVISVVPGQHAFVRLLLMPAMKKSEMEQAVRFQAEGQIPIPAAELVLDHALVSEHKATKQMEVLVAATRKSIIQQYLHLFNQAGLLAKVFDLEALALERVLFRKNRPVKQGEIDIIASIGANNTHISGFAGDVLRFTRSIPFGGQRFTRALATERAISPEAAEESKLAGELPTETRALLEDLGGELRRSIDFFQNQNKDQVIKQVLLAGGGSLLPGLKDFLAQKLDMPVDFGNPSEQLKIGKRVALPDNAGAWQAGLAPALGLAIRGLK